MVSSRLSPAKPGAMTVTSTGAKTTPRITTTDTARASSAPIAPATRSASSCSFPETSPAYTGMKDAERAPSPKRFWRRLGMRKAAVKASAAAEVPR